MPFNHGYALVIGIGQYQNMSQYNVPIAAKDAAQVGETLLDAAHCGYPAGQVTILCNAAANRQAILAALDGLAGKLDEASTFFLFYVGHGVYGTDGNYHLTSHDTQLLGRQVKAGTGISDVELIDRLRKIKARRMLLVINACHAGELSPSFSPGDEEFASQAPPQKLSQALLSTGEGRITITACRPEQKSWIGTGPLSIFTRAVVSGLRGEAPNNRGYISAYGLYEYIYFACKDAAAGLGQVQEPELTVLKGVGPFPVALYNGASQIGNFDPAETPPLETAVHEVSPQASLRAFQRYQASINGSGAIAQGEGSKAINIEGDVNGIMIIGDNGKAIGTNNGTIEDM